MSLEDVKDSNAFAAIEMQIRKEIDTNVDDYCLREDRTFAVREESDASFREF